MKKRVLILCTGNSCRSQMAEGFWRHYAGDRWDVFSAGLTPIGAYQSIQHPLADLAIRQEAVRLMTYRAARLFDQGASASDLAESANAAKYLAAELAVRSVDAAIDTFGGKGFDEDHGIIHLWEAARLLKTAPISDALILNQTAERCLGLPRSY